MSNDAIDVAAATAGSPEAFARLYDRHAPVVLSLCRRGLSIAEADDATQEAFLRAYRRLRQLDDPTKLRPWLFAIARRVCAERRRSAGRRTRHETQAMLNHAQSQNEDRTAADAVDQDEQLDRLTAAIDALPEHERLAIHLHYLDPDPTEGAAATLSLSRSAYYRLLARARQHLAVLMHKGQPS